MADGPRLICPSEDLQDNGLGVRFEITLWGRTQAAFAIRYQGRVYAYQNRCAHVPTELDWLPGQFFDGDRQLIICGTHGAVYDPRSGRCVGGPCRGGRLSPVAVCERDGGVWLEPLTE